MTPRVAIAFCLHHKPWLGMATLISTLMQEGVEGTDLYCVYTVGDGSCPGRPSYESYRRLGGVNPKLSPFDARVRRIAHLRRPGVHELEFENDHALDSGAWYKFIRTGRWRDYDAVICMQEGTLFTRPTALSAMVRMAQARPIHFLAAGHYKSRLPKRLMLAYNSRQEDAGALEAFHDQMIRATFEVFCRDEAFRALFDGWSSQFPPTQQNHVPDLWGPAPWRRLRTVADQRGPLTAHPLKRPAAAWLRAHRGWFARVDAWQAAWSVGLARVGAARPRIGVRSRGLSDAIYVDQLPTPLSRVVDEVEELDGVKFHREEGPEWHGCSCNHLFSRAFLERFSERIERLPLDDALALPFAGSALEVIWGFLPNWLGVEKWFFDGWHRVMKQFATYRREDDAEGMAGYLNRYYRGRLCVGWEGDYLKVRMAARGDAARLRAILDPVYFG